MSRIVSRDEIRSISAMMEQRGIPLHVWLPIMHVESSGNVYAHNPRGEDSRGLFQINLRAGQDGRWTPDFVRGLNLFDPLVNARAILSESWLGNTRRLKTMLTKTNPAEQTAYMYQHGIRPRYTPELDRRIRYLATDGLADLKRRYGLTGEGQNITSQNNIPFVPTHRQEVPFIPTHEPWIPPPEMQERSIVLDFLRGGLNFIGRFLGIRPVSFEDISFLLIRAIIIIVGVPLLIFTTYKLILESDIGSNAIKYVLAKGGKNNDETSV